MTTPHESGSWGQVWKQLLLAPLNHGRSGTIHTAQSTPLLDSFQQILPQSNSVNLGIFFHGTDQQSSFIWPLPCYSNISKTRPLLTVAGGTKRNLGYTRRIYKECFSNPTQKHELLGKYFKVLLFDTIHYILKAQKWKNSLHLTFFITYPSIKAAFMTK